MTADLQREAALITQRARTHFAISSEPIFMPSGMFEILSPHLEGVYLTETSDIPGFIEIRGWTETPQRDAGRWRDATE